jgi:hypothetical protein
MALGAGMILAIHPFGEDHPAVTASRGSPPGDNLGLDDNDLNCEDDDPSSMVVQPQGIRVFPRSPTAMGMNAARHVCSWRSHFLVRPQLLTRL